MDKLITKILDGACPNGNPAEDGWNGYWIETHCVGYNVTARKVAGVWEILKWDAESI